MAQLPAYRPEARDAQAPRPGPPAQTQENNGGPKGFGQPQAQNRMSAPAQAPGPSNLARSRGAQAQGPAMPPPGSGQPGSLYPQLPPDFQSQLWQNRNSMPPMDLITAAFMQLQGRQPSADEVGSLLQSSPNTDHLIEQLLNIQNPGQPQYMQQIVNPQPVF